MAHQLARCLLALAVLGLSGCATFSPDSGMTAVSDLTSQTINKDVPSCERQREQTRSTTAFVVCSRAR
jgi:hypothetical protein